jgi:hypothetical protein
MAYVTGLYTTKTNQYTTPRTHSRRAAGQKQSLAEKVSISDAMRT